MNSSALPKWADRLTTGQGFKGAWARVGVAAALFVTGCSATTRIGELIPGHTRSDHTDGELVTATYLPVGPRVMRAGSETRQRVVGVAPVAALLAGVAVDVARKALLKEAERYEHGYDARLLLTTEEMGTEGIIVLTRWITEKQEKVKQATSPDSSEYEGAHLVPDIESQVLLNGSSAWPSGSESVAIDAALKNRPDGKKPAMILTLRVKQERGTTVYRISGAKLWVKDLGAKVVAFGWQNAARPWQWLGGVIMKTDGRASFKATVAAKALVGGENKQAAWVDITPETASLADTKLNLYKLPAYADLKNHLGSWLAVPAYSPEAKMGFLILSFTFTEKDTSNTAEYLKEGAEAIEKKKGSTQDLVKKWFGG